ncbi:hypothetical protein MUCCIDRAFT_113913 [Mucor lusitanicus CBS 277.49]|uniref:Calcium-channel protein CCH1 n=1 Tax=Mucor lusitanicus CBS 277.49 TaxID=747725 RepID=A0A168IW43_MUCCL|nr:hypothetical protein MUCCIDRAFT_113913 [Mucor lusitanicus CBS 277.49]
MAESDTLSDSKDIARKPPPAPQQQEITIPQIILTEPPTQQQSDANTTIHTSTSPHALSPKSVPHKPSPPASSTVVSSSPLPSPLPLTKDLLQRKNKLDKLLSQKEKHRYYRQQQQRTAADFNSSSLVDERVTAGLGISTPHTDHGASSSMATNTSGLRSRLSSSNRSEPEKPMFSPSSLGHHSEWSYELDAFKSSTSGSSKGHHHRHQHSSSYHHHATSGTSVSGSSNRNSVSMRAYSANHRYMDRQHGQHGHTPYFERPDQHLNRHDEYKSKYFLLDLLIHAVNRVVNSRAPESKQVSDREIFDFNTSPFKTAAAAAIHDTPSPPLLNEKSMEPASPQIMTPATTTTNRNNRYSWLSFATSLDEKSFDVDNDSLFPSEKKRASLHDAHQLQSLPPLPPPPPPPIQMTAKKPLSLSDELLPNPLQGHSLCLFGPTNKFRIHVWRFIRKRYVETFIFFLMILHWFLLACVPITTNEEKSQLGGQWTHYPILCIQALYSIEAICKIIAYGLIIPPKPPTLASVNQQQQEDQEDLIKSWKRNHYAYLNSFGNCFDTVSIISYWADLIIMVYKYPYLSLFKSLGAIRPIRLLSMLRGTAVILKSLETSWDILLAVSGLIFFFLLLFALVGLISFQGVFSRRCYYTADDSSLQLVQPALYCSGYMNDTTVVGAYNVETGESSYPGYHGYLCAAGQICIEDPVNNPNYGFVNFDTIFFSFLNVYTFVSLELWTDLMYQTQEADSTVAALYYCLGVYIIAFVLTFLLFAVITSAFARVRAESAVSAFTAKKKGYPVLRDAEGLDDEAMWMFDNPPDDLGKGVTRLKLRWWIVRMVKSRAFFYFGGFLVLFDLIFMCLRSFYASKATLELVDNAETAFTFVFALEILLRMVGATSWMSFWSAKTNLFDLFLVISTCVIQLPMIQDSWAYKYLTIFQILRLYRLFICIPRVRRLLSAALGTGESVIYVMVFLILATALCSTVFMQMFGGDYTDVTTPEDPENRFDTFWESFVSLIVVYTSERWTDVLYDAMASQHGQGSIYAAAALSLYFAFGRYIMSGLYIAVVLENFELSDDYIRHYQIKDFIHRHRFKDKDRTETILLKLFRPFYYFNENKNVQISELPANLTAPLTKSDLTELLTDLPKKRNQEELKQPSWIERKLTVFFSSIRQRIPFLRKKTSIKSAPINPFMQDTEDAPEDYDMITAEENREAQKENTPVVNSLFLFSNRSRFRYYCKKLVGSSNDGQAEKHNLFNWMVMACVLVSILMVILDEPSTRLIRKDTSRQDIYDTIEIVLSIVFIVEVSIRIVADGFLLTPNAYLRNHWNQLDLCVILLNIVTIFMSSEEAPRGLSTFRSLRILRLIRYFNGVRDIFVALFYAFPLMFDALIFTFLVLVPFAVYGVNIFGGLMWMCNDESVGSRGDCIGEFELNVSSDDGIDVNIWIPRVWQNPQNGFISYDNFPLALQHLFSLTSTEGWVDSMFSAMSIPHEPDVQPSFNWYSSTVYHGIFYIVFMIFSQGTMQLFVGVIIEKFKERNGITTLTTAQRKYMDLQRLLSSVKPTIKVFRPESKLRQICYDMVIKKHGKFNRLMMCVICLNIVAIASEFQNEPHWLEELQDYSYLGFTIIYVVECIIKLLGLGWKKWIRSKWNWFDCIIASCALLLLILRFALPDLWTLRVERYCLVLAAFRLGEGIDSLQTLYHTIAKSMPSIIQVSAVFMVAMCLFAMLFMEFFGLTKYGVYGTSHVNFRDYGNALLLLVRATTGEAWNAILVDYTVQYPNCNRSSNYLEDDCGSPFWAYFLFDIFYIVCTHIFMNLFTAVIISNFEYAYETRTRFTNITKADLRMFKHAWADIDTKGTGYIQKEDVAKLLRKFTGRFSFRIYDDQHRVDNIIRHGFQSFDKQRSSYTKSPSAKSPAMKSPGKSSPAVKSGHSSLTPGEYDINVQEINRLLGKMDVDQVRKRRLEYNLYYKEILRSETSKGIPFASVLTIMSYRFIDISTSLTLDPLIARLEKIEQLTQEYHLEKAAGFFLAQIQKRRFVRQLWMKRDEDEVKKLGVTNPSQFDFGAMPPNNGNSPLDSPINYFNLSPDKKKRSPPVPRIVIDNASANTELSSPVSAGSVSIPVSPMSTFSMDNQYDPSYSGGGYSLMVAPGTNSMPSSPNTMTEMESTGRSAFSGALSPISPFPALSPASRQNWLLIDGNVEMPNEVSEGLMDSMNHSIWSDMLRDEDL